MDALLQHGVVHFVAEELARTLMHCRIDNARADDVDPYSLRSQLRGNACRQSDQTMLRRNVSSAVRETKNELTDPTFTITAVSGRKHGSGFVFQT